MRLFLKGVQYLVAAFVLYTFYNMLYWLDYYSRLLPRTIEPQEGRIIPLILGHNITVYATLLERQKLEDAVNLACLGVATMVFIMLAQFFMKFRAEKGGLFRIFMK